MMISNYLKTATRNLGKNKFFTTLNIFALALGMSISLVFIATLTFLFRYDNFHANRERIYRVITRVQDNNNNPSYASAPVALWPLLKNNVAGLEKIVRINGSLNGSAVQDDKEIPLSGYFADPEFLTMFSFPLLQGDYHSALTKPNTIVITEAAARKIFGKKEALGELITIKPYGEVVITGVLKELPKNSHLTFEAIVSYATLLTHESAAFHDNEKSWTRFTDSYIYLLLSQNVNPDGIEQYLARVAKEKYIQKDIKASFSLQRLNDIAPGPALYNAIGPSWDYLGVTLVGLITMIILIPACANYVTLAISQSLRRMKEIGVRKVMGGQKKQIFMQFVMETTITVLLALVISYLLFELIRGEAVTAMEATSMLDLSPTPVTFAGFILFALFVGFIAGVVPALYFAKVAPLNALKGKEVRSNKRGGFPIGKIVMTTQFILSLGFIMAVVIVMRQYHYSTNYNLGFDQQNILDVELQRADEQLVKNEFKNLSSVAMVSMSSHAIGTGFHQGYIRLTEQDSLETSSISIDEDFIQNLKLELLRGSNFSSDKIANTRFIIVNEELARKIKPEDPFAAINEVVDLQDGKEVRVGGIIRNFHYDNLRSPIANFYFSYEPEDFHYANVKLHSKDPEDIHGIEASWKKLGGDDPFQAQFLQDEIGNAYKFYFELIKLWSFLGLLAITVACLGLLGTVVFTIRTRVKEISLRKVMGASSESLVILLSKDFVFMMIVATIITVPVMYFMFERLLRTQYYRLEIGWLEIAVSVSILFLLGLSSIFSQTLKAANMNPVDNLRVE